MKQRKTSQYSLVRNIPHLITGSRGVLVPLLFINIVQQRIFIASSIMVIACITDLLDGFIARRMGYTSQEGAFFDCFMDFMIVIAGFSGLAFIGVVPLWIIVLNTLMFVQFIISFRSGSVVYDPAGRIFGIIVIWSLIVILVVPSQLAISVTKILLVSSSGTSLIFRYIFKIHQ